MWHRICFQEITAFFNFTNTVQREREKERASVRDVPSFPISACMLLRRSTSSDVQRALLWSGGLNKFSLCSFVLVYSLPVIKASAWGHKEREGFIISGSGGDMNFPFSLLACPLGLIKTELSATAD